MVLFLMSQSMQVVWVPMLVMVRLVSARLIVRPNAHGSRDPAQIVEHRDVSEPQLTPGNRQHRQHAYLRRLLLRPEDLPWQGAFRRARPSRPPQPMPQFRSAPTHRTNTRHMAWGTGRQLGHAPLNACRHAAAGAEQC